MLPTTTHARNRSRAAPHPATARPHPACTGRTSAAATRAECPADAQIVEIGQAGERLGQRGDRRVLDVPARPFPTTSHARVRSHAAPHPATARPHPACTGRTSAAPTRAGADRRTHSQSRLDRLLNDSGSAVIGVFEIALHGCYPRQRTRATDRVPHRIQPQPRPTPKCTGRTSAAATRAECPAHAQFVEIGQAGERLGQRGDRRVHDIPARPFPTTTHARVRSRAAPHPATVRPHPACTGRASAAATRAECPADAQPVEIGQAAERLGQRGDRRVNDPPARPLPTTSHTRASDRVPHRIQPQPGRIQRAPDARVPQPRAQVLIGGRTVSGAWTGW